MVSRNPNTPAMRQYLEAKAAHPDALLFFRMGDFYELFFEDATEAAHLLELTLTSRDKKSENPVPMAGVPHHAARGYIQRLVEMGKKVAICEQVEDPAKAKGIVKREVTHVVTPGVYLDEQGLDARSPNYLMALASATNGYALAYADVSTGEFYASTADSWSLLWTELARIEPREILADESLLNAHPELSGLETLISVVEAPEKPPTAEARKALLPSGLEGSDEVATAAFAISSYLERNHPQARRTLQPLSLYRVQDTMILEESTLVNLELLRTIMTGRRRGSLLGLMDQTVTAMGARTLRRWIQFPLLDLGGIGSRLDAVEALQQDTISREELREQLRNVYDLERLCGRVQAGVASPKDLAALRTSLQRIPSILAYLEGLGAPRLTAIANETDPIEDVCSDLETTLAENPSQALKDGNVIREGYDPDLDELIGLARDGRSWLLEYEEKERSTTGIPSLKVRYNRVFGYYIEVTKANVGLVPERYVRKQTLVNAERYFTEELKEYEEKVLTAEERRLHLETTLFESLRDRVAARAEGIGATARTIAELDVYCGLADLAQTRGYSRPTVDDSRLLLIKNGRHPVIEALMKEEPFIPNDLHLDTEGRRLTIITGPNMSGKSTVMRQAALITLMAQVGSFVPADEAHIGVVDRIFTRVGASDNLTRGQSTFMVEMTETATILEKATEKSLIILDEIGRGTSTYDGVSIAWAVAEYIHEKLGSRCLFATHYHELTELEESLQGARNMHIAVKEYKDDIVFLRKLQPGGTNRSYGIQVGRLAGLPSPVIDRAKMILQDLEAQHAVQPTAPGPQSESAQLSLFGALSGPSAVDQEIEKVELDTFSPIEALNFLYELKRKQRETSN